MIRYATVDAHDMQKRTIRLAVTTLESGDDNPILCEFKYGPLQYLVASNTYKCRIWGGHEENRTSFVYTNPQMHLSPRQTVIEAAMGLLHRVNEQQLLHRMNKHC